MRRKTNLARTYVCAVKFWRTAPQIPTLASGVRHVVRKQGFRSKDIYAQEKRLQRNRLIDMSEGINKTVRLTTLGERAARCGDVRLSPWTDPGYPGAALEAVPQMTRAQSERRIRELRRRGCKVTKKRVRGVGTVILKECPRR